MAFQQIKLCGAIQRAYEKGSSPTETFKSLCQENGYELSLDTLIDLWFKNDGTSTNLTLNLQSPNHEKYLKLLQTIHRQYSLLDKAIHMWTFNQFCSFFPTNPRYSITRYKPKGSMSEEMTGFRILNYYHGQERELPLTNGPFQTSEELFLPRVYAVNSDYVLIFDKTMAFVLYLFKINLNTFSSKFLDENEVGFVDSEIVFDEQDSTRFMIIGNFENADENDANTVAIGRIKNDKIQMHNNFAKISRNIFCFKLMKDKLCGLQKIFDSEDKFIGVGFWEMMLNNPKGKGEAKFQFKFECDFSFEKFHYETSTWSKTTCYVYCKNREFENVYAFDFVSGKCTCFWNKCDTIINMCVDENDVLSIQAFSAVYRFSISQPKKLQDIAWLNVRRLSKFSSDNDFYKKVVSKLPINSELRPFYFKF